MSAVGSINPDGAHAGTPPRKPNTVYIGLKEAGKGVKGIRVHKRKTQVFIQVLP
jgi:hypothetical protein